MNEQLLKRIGDDNLRAAAAKTIEIAASFIARRATINKDTRFTEAGRLDAITADLEKEFLPALRSARQPLRAARDAIAARKAKITLPPVDRNDIVGAIERMEMRAFVRSLSEVERTKLLFSKDANHRLIDAVLGDSSPELSGIPRDRFDELLNQRLRQLHGAEMDAVDRNEEALAAAEAAVAVAMQQMRTAFDPRNGERFSTIVAEAA